MPGCKAPWTVKNAKPGKIRQRLSCTVIRWCSRTACLISLSHSYDEVVARYLRWYAVLTWLCSDRRLQQYCLKSICNNAPVTFRHYLSHSLFDINLFLYLCYVVLSSLNFLRLKALQQHWYLSCFLFLFTLDPEFQSLMDKFFEDQAASAASASCNAKNITGEDDGYSEL